jgi:nicotinate phosphoribosyltransferase
MGESTALLTDRYELTMIDAALRGGRADRACVFEAFARRLSGGRRYGVVAGIGRILDALDEFRFGSAELDWLRAEHVVAAETIDFLADYRFRGTIRAYREGEFYFPGSPVVQVEGTFADSVILETVILSILNADCAVATAASRMVTAADGHDLIEMGSRRTGEHSAVAAARAAYIAGFSATSNLEAGRRFGIPTRGTAAHSFTLLHDSEEAAFRAQIDALGTSTTLLVDTYDVHAAIDTAIRVAGTGLGAVRLDSGDLPSLVRDVRAQLDSLGATATKIVVTNDLNENTIAALRGTPVDVFGVGTSVVTGGGYPAAGFVYKLVEHVDDSGNWVSVAKRSPAKSNPGGRKRPVRVLEHGIAVEERIFVGDVGASNDTVRPLDVEVVSNGVIDKSWRGKAGTVAAREHHATVRAEFGDEALRLSPGDPAIPTVIHAAR